MPDGSRLSPITTTDIAKLLQGIFSDPDAPTDLALEAFAVTAASLYGWCDPADVERAVATVSPIRAVA